MLNLITNRQEEDMLRVQAILNKPKSLRTSLEQLEVDSFASKGAYNYTDLNRVVGAMEYLNSLFESWGYVTEYSRVMVSSDRYFWIENEKVQPQHMVQYLNNLEALRKILFVLSSTPRTPSTMVGLTTTSANNIEQILLDIEYLLEHIVLAQPKANQYFSHSNAVMYWPELAYYLADKAGVLLADTDGYLLMGKVN